MKTARLFLPVGARPDGGVAPSPRRHQSRARRGLRAASLLELPGASASGAFSLRSGCQPLHSFRAHRPARRTGNAAGGAGVLSAALSTTGAPDPATHSLHDAPLLTFWRQGNASAPAGGETPATLRFGGAACGRFSPSADTLTLSAHSARPPRLRPGATDRTARGSCVGSLPTTAAPLTECATFTRQGAAA